jgi:CDP-glucose 4,6-dehydratase
MESMVTPEYWTDKKVLVTGHTGFKGSWLCHWLLNMGAKVTGYALAPESEDSMFKLLNLDTRTNSIIANINNYEGLVRCVKESNPDVVFHLAAQALVRPGYEDPLGTFETNILGTANLLKASASVSHHCDVIIVTSDKCYLNREDHHHYDETDPLGGRDPYSASKACAEIVTASFRDSYCSPSGPHSNIHIATARAGNVIGGGDFAVDRLIPDSIRARISNKTIEVRNPHSVRPWQHVLEPLSGYLLLAEQMNNSRDYCESWNFGPSKDEVISVEGLLQLAIQQCPEIKFSITTNPGPHEAGLLLLNADAADERLHWKPKWPIEEAVKQTYAWYNAWLHGDDMMAYTTLQIDQYAGSPDSGQDSGQEHG